MRIEQDAQNLIDHVTERKLKQLLIITAEELAKSQYASVVRIEHVRQAQDDLLQQLAIPSIKTQQKTFAGKLGWTVLGFALSLFTLVIGQLSTTGVIIMGIFFPGYCPYSHHLRKSPLTF